VGYKADITLLTLAQPLVKPIDSAGWVFIIVEKNNNNHVRTGRSFCPLQ
jgi:hypothetical protein